MPVSPNFPNAAKYLCKLDSEQEFAYNFWKVKTTGLLFCYCGIEQVLMLLDMYYSKNILKNEMMILHLD